MGSLAAAVACEFTVVLTDARRKQGAHRTVPLAAAASATGYGVLAVSGVASIREFGLLLAVTVVGAVVGVEPPEQPESGTLDEIAQEWIEGSAPPILE